METVDYTETFARLKQKLRVRNEKHSPAPFAGKHEMLGVLIEEVHELIEAVRGNEPWRVDAEAADIAVVVIHWLQTREIS